MNKSIDLELCFLVHTRKYTDSKNIVTLLTQHQGLISGVLRVQKRKKMIINPPVFCPLHISWIGKSGLKTISYWESTNKPLNLLGSSLFCAIYINEIVARLLHEEESNSDMFTLYSSALHQLSRSDGKQLVQEKVLRVFELSMLRALGFEINLYTDVEGSKIDAKNVNYYVYDPQLGFTKASENQLASSTPINRASNTGSLEQAPILNRSLPARNNRQQTAIYYGPDLFNIVQGEWNEGSLKAAKRLTRLAFLPLLGGKPIKARELFT